SRAISAAEDLRRVPEPRGAAAARPARRAQGRRRRRQRLEGHAHHRAQRPDARRHLPADRRLASLSRARDGDHARSPRRDPGRLGEIFVDPPDYAILNPVAPGRANLSVIVPLSHAAPWSGRLDTFFDARVKHLPHLARRIAGGRRVAPVRAMGPLAYRVDPPRTGGVLMVGDATGFFDPFSGEGIFNGLRSAELAVETAVQALGRGDV